jgi:hypothetical protein
MNDLLGLPPACQSITVTIVIAIYLLFPPPPLLLLSPTNRRFPMLTQCRSDLKRSKRERCVIWGVPSI